MSMTIQHPRIEQLAQEIATQTGENITQVIISALEKRLQQLSTNQIMTAEQSFEQGWHEAMTGQVQPVDKLFTSEPFIGMWKDRTEMNDSREWVKNLRQKEWG